MTTATRTWTETKDGFGATNWWSDDGEARVVVRRFEDGWKVFIYENGQYIGSEPTSTYRSGAVGVARKWIRAMARPVE